jgi:RimJ/RimL family protein N-acetyltransferase
VASAGAARAVALREVADGDLPAFFEFHRDRDAGRMAAFTHKDPDDRAAFLAHWAKIRGDGGVLIRTVLCDGTVAGYVSKFLRSGTPEVCYWLGRTFWGRGVATRALSQFLPLVAERPLQARVADDNVASLRVLQKCGFAACGRDRFFANARGREIDELILELR